ncbi:hypothetical protein QYF61_015431 [Mycteria americana]|uniref:Uncharacterized protein n=1 Tax=Mycteria americana TaxID=33587 RepID=A0AAN7PTM0_MYCAM|nr:hypothetical protein QYF61_015431 [Mycteria americana]
MKFNKGKCKVLHLGRKNPMHEYILGSLCYRGTNDTVREIRSVSQRQYNREEAIRDNFLTQVIKELTRGDALLDLILTNNEGLVGDVKVVGRPAWMSKELLTKLRHKNKMCIRGGCITIHRDFKRLEKLEDRSLMKYNRRECQVLNLGRNNPLYQHRMGANCVESCYAENDLGCWWTTSSPYASNAPLRQRKQTASWAALGRPLPAGDPCPLLSTGETHLEVWVQLWSPQYKRDILKQRATKMMKRLEPLTYERAVTVQPGKEKARGSCPCVQIPDGGGKEARPFSVVPIEKTRGNGHKLKYRKLHLNVREKYFTVRMVEDLNPVVQ